MLKKYLLLCCVLLLSIASTESRSGLVERIPVPLCRALERLESGDQIPVIVSGLYSANNTFYDPGEPACRLNVDPSVCIEFSPGIKIPEEFGEILDKSKRAFSTFSGILYSQVGELQASNPLLPTTARLAASDRSRFCGHLFQAKLTVDSIVDFKEVPESFPWSGSSPEDVSTSPLPLEMALPTYPWPARNLQIEGTVLVRVSVIHGTVTDVKVQFGDPILAEETLANVKTWNFAPELDATFGTEFEFRLEKRTASEGDNPKYEMRLPGYLKVVGARKDR